MASFAPGDKPAGCDDEDGERDKDGAYTGAGGGEESVAVASNFSPHLGHFTRRPISSSRRFSRAPQDGQLVAWGMGPVLYTAILTAGITVRQADYKPVDLSPNFDLS